METISLGQLVQMKIREQTLRDCRRIAEELSNPNRDKSKDQELIEKFEDKMFYLGYNVMYPRMPEE